MAKNKIKVLMTLTILVSMTSLAYQPENKSDNNWSIINSPSNHIPESIGSYANGCMEGGQFLPKKGAGFTSVRRNRHRFFGQPKLIDFITGIGNFIDGKYQRQLLIGDMSQAKGGPMNFGHSSHQTGLDVDIWIQSQSKYKKISPYKDMKSIVNRKKGIIKQPTIEKPIRDALHYASTHPSVARVFVNPVIKQHLCQTERNTRWLNKIRPWWGHDEHFHVRLSCPLDSHDCENQKPVGYDDGCNDSLYQWVNQQSDIALGKYKPKKTKKKKTKKRKKKTKKLPLQCEVVRVAN